MSSRGLLQETERGSRRPVSPFSKPIRPAGSTERRRTLDDPPYLLGRGLRCRKYRYEHAALGFGTKLDPTVDQREQGMVAADTHIAAGMPLGAALARNNLAGGHFFAAKNLNSEPLTGGIAAVARGAACFLVSHRSNLSDALPIPDS